MKDQERAKDGQAKKSWKKINELKWQRERKDERMNKGARVKQNRRLPK